MEPTKTQPTMSLKGAATSAGAARARGGPTAKRSEPRRDEPGIPLNADPDKVAEQILARLGQGLYLPARDLAREAAARFPSHARLQKLWWSFDNRGKSWVASGGPEPGRAREFEWLRHPPEWARGKWVALVDSEAVAVGDTLREVAESVRSQNLSRRPLVHRVD